MGDPTRLSQVHDAGMTLWCLCRQCGHSSLFDPAHLAQRLKIKADELEQVARRLKCSRCSSTDGKLVPTRRTMVSFRK